jgi:MEMO1 family protein
MSSEKEDMLCLARAAVEAHVLDQPRPQPSPTDGRLAKPGACFVTLRIEGNLRGCVGTILPTCTTLAAELVGNAIAACSRDTRFSPVSREELASLQYSLYILEEPESVSDASQLNPHRYGVIVTAGSKRGVLLPGIPGIETVEQQLKAVREKAGICPSAVYSMMRLEVEKIP